MHKHVDLVHSPRTYLDLSGIKISPLNLTFISQKHLFTSSSKNIYLRSALNSKNTDPASGSVEKLRNFASRSRNLDNIVSSIFAMALHVFRNATSISSKITDFMVFKLALPAK